MHRTQLMLSEEEYLFLADEARRARKSMSSVIREWIDARMQACFEVPMEQDTLWGMVGIAHGGAGRASERHDQLLAAARLKRMPKRTNRRK